MAQDAGMSDGPNKSRTLFSDSWALRGGLLLLVIGSGPLVAINLAAKPGLTSDPNPNPVGLGIMAGLSLFPSPVMMIARIMQVIWTNRGR